MRQRGSRPAEDHPLAALIELQHVSKTYRSPLRRRSVQALDDLSLTISRGEVLGIAGPNGAGKTTLLAIILGYLRSSGGRITLDGLRPRRFVETRGVTYLSELVQIPAWWSVAGALRRYAVLEGIRGRDVRVRVDAVIERLGIGEHRAKRVKQLSKGNLQRLGLAQALLSDTSIVVLDEPTHGLDPIWTQRFRDIVGELRRSDRVIIIASHNLDELERLADRVAILDRGRLSRIADNAALHVGAADYRLVLANDLPDLAAFFPAVRRSDAAREISYIVRGTLDEVNEGLRRLLDAGGRVRALYPEQSRLEAAFREAVGEA